MTLVKTNNLLATLLTIVSVKNIKGTSFVGVQNYQNKEGEISNQTFLVGIDYTNMLKNDLQKLLAFDPLTMETNIDKGIVLQAHADLVTSLRKRLADESVKDELRAKGDATIKASDAQKDAYEHIAKGLKVQDGYLYLYGLMVRKTVIQKGNYKTVNSAALTIAKNQIKKAADLRETKYKQFKLGRKEDLKINGLTL
jgi:hypothetical protein